jgi:ABC-type dipeptide/oligopeptide/nickel transport system ATPase subunit
MPEPLLQGRHISVTFGRGPRAVAAVQDVSVAADTNETVGIVGESGSGKTTVARVLVGLQKPTAGQVLLDGRTVAQAGSGEAYSRAERGKVQMVFQDPYSALNPRMRAWEGVAEAIHVWHKIPGRQAREQAFDLLQSMGVSSEQAARYPSSLSGGQRQRVSIARALAPEPRVLVADEPTSAIDQSAQAHLLNLLREIQQERGLTIVFISHNLALVRYLTTRVYIMQAGQVVESGSTSAIFLQPQHPYTTLLINSMPGNHVSE